MATQRDVFDAIRDTIDNKFKGEVYITGNPGTGKSYLINLLSNNTSCAITATTNKAVSIYSYATTIYKYLGLSLNTYTNKIYKTNRYPHNLKNSVVIIDEASMIDEKLYSYIKPLTKYNLFIYVGDKYQLPPVKSKFNIFDHVKNDYELTEVYRQNTDNSIITTCNDIKDSIDSNYKYQLKPSKNIIFLNKEDSINKLDDLFTEEEENNICLAYTNKTVTDYNNHIRENMRMFNALTNNGATGKFPSVKEKVIVNDVVTMQGKPIVLSDTDFIIEDVRDMGSYYLINGSYIYHKDMKKYKRELNKLYKDYKEDRCTTQDIDNHRNNVIDIRPRYAQTTHKSQGSTYDNVFIDLNDINSCKDTNLYNRMLYVALSRAKENVYVYT